MFYHRCVINMALYIETTIKLFLQPRETSNEGNEFICTFMCKCIGECRIEHLNCEECTTPMIVPCNSSQQPFLFMNKMSWYIGSVVSFFAIRFLSGDSL